MAAASEEPGASAQDGGGEGFLELFFNLAALVCLIFGHAALLSAAGNQRFDVLLADAPTRAGSGDAAQVNAMFLGHAADQRRAVNARRHLSAVVGAPPVAGAPVEPADADAAAG